MTNFRSCHPIVNRKLPDDRRHVRDFIDADFLLGRYFYFIFEMDSIHKHYIFSRYDTHFGETLNISAASDSTFTVFPPQLERR